jgi:hypothetical protein
MKFSGIPTARERTSFVLRGLNDFADDLASFGETVGPRIGPSKRTAAQREDWCIRRFLIALREEGRMPFPIRVAAFLPSEAVRLPDYVFEFGDGTIVGVEVTEATEQDFQRESSDTAHSSGMRGLREEGYAGDEAERVAVDAILEAIERKARALGEDKYRDVPACELLIYENYRSRIVAEQGSVAERVSRTGSNAAGAFRAVHLLRDESIVIDLFGRQFSTDFADAYEHDYARWLEAQARLARGKRVQDLDLAHIAEELEALARNEERALRSQIRRLLHHLLKWQFQPKGRSASRTRTIINARDEIEDRIAASPKFGRTELLTRFIEEEYARARRNASREANLSARELPLSCPYTIDNLLDADFPWGEGAPA